MEQFLHTIPQVLSDGLTLGFVYALVALGYTMVYGILQFINFAHSEVFMFGAFTGTEVLLFLKSSGYLANLPAPLALIIALVIAMVLTGTLGVMIERIAYRPLRNAPRLVPFISAIGVSFFLQDAVRLVVGLFQNTFYLRCPPLFSGMINISSDISVPKTALILVSTSLIMMFGLHLFIMNSKTGKAMRAVAQDQTAASLMSINIDKIISFTFLIGAALGGAAGTLFATQYSLITPYVGFILGIKAFTAAVFGGIGNIPGAMLGGVLLGILESLGAYSLSYITHGAMGAEYKDVFAFVILIIVLLFKPSGLLGEEVGEKV